MDSSYGQPSPQRMSGDEPILDATGSPAGRLIDIWRWAYSGTLDNTQRGVIAEYVVGLAVDGIRGGVRVDWDAFDLLTPDGLKVEVKSAAYLQSWRQDRPSKIQFGIAETVGWTAATNTYAEVLSRQADVYVFCLFTSTEREEADPLDTRQWRFWVTSTAHLTEVVGRQKTISLNALLSRVGPDETDFAGLREAVRRATR
ncbi:hypothetical protein NYP18_04035 [Corynebacterium sp. YIM 101645]|uniref:Restriction endonuclease n=1 Tax=Corynebacterium lemuris TaxID=1859292 RepID=A0ABT2FUB8_9CORY|nr:hypothetical protein [Corynebacterium lemuris]MCS5478821.1 hypothetical protein [Corynebacterium lemuris]